MDLPIINRSYTVSQITKKSRRENVYLIDLGTGTDRSLLPLASGLVASYCDSIPQIHDAYDIKIMMMSTNLEDLVDEIEDPAVIGVSCYCWNFLGSSIISQALREKYPDALIVWGGPSVPNRPHRITTFAEEHSYVDIFVHGEGELTFAEILLRHLSGDGMSDCLGTVYNDGSKWVMNPSRSRIQDFNIIPSPFLNGMFDDLLSRYGDFIVGALWETSRGCPFKCTFCDWGNALVNKVNRLEVDRVLQEIEWVGRNNIHYVYATDANFGITVQRDLEIAKGFVDISKRYSGLPNTLILNWTKNSHKNIVQIAEALSQGGVATNVTLSYQSFHPPTVAAMKRDNIKPDYLNELKKEFHAKQCATYNELILGLPEETLESFVSGLDRGLSFNLKDQLMVYLCCILVNTELKEDMEKYGIQTRTCAVGLNRRKCKYEKFGIDEIVVGTSTMPAEDWKFAYEIAFTLLSLHNLRVAFFICCYLNYAHDALITDYVKFILEEADNYEQIGHAVNHVRNNRQLILDEVSSVSSIEGSDGVKLTPHEAMTFSFYSNLDQTYADLRLITEKFCKIHGHKFDKDIMDDVFLYQKNRIPTFESSGQSRGVFKTTIPIFFEHLTSGKEPPSISKRPTVVEYTHKDHSYKTEKEFNLRRVSCGYSINMVDFAICDDMKETGESFIPLSRNTNLSGSFE